MNLVFACRDENDLFTTLARMGLPPARFDRAEEAVAAAPKGAGLLLLADDYPRPTTRVTAKLLKAAAAKRLQLYVEYPAAMDGLKLGEPTPTEWERLVVSTDFFSPAVDRLEILAAHGCWLQPVKAARPHLVAARVAGYRTAVHGLPNDVYPILFAAGRTMLVATTGLSRFVRARYGPRASWAALWKRLLEWLSRGEVPELSWHPSVRVAYGPDEALPVSAETDAIERSFDWFRREAVYGIGAKVGAVEGFEAGIDTEGRQRRRIWVRGDCTGETGMTLAFDWALSRNPAHRRTAEQVLDYVWSSPDFYHDNPDDPAWGLNNWFQDGPAFYGDDNARVIMPTLAASRLMGCDRWDERVLRCLLANLRTTSPTGFREGRIEHADFFKDNRGWTYFRDTDVYHFAPHYQGYLWAAFLWAYALTGYEPFLEKPRRALRTLMEHYPKWEWTNGMTQELARAMLPLAFLVRVDDRREHRGWLNRIGDDLLALMQPSGAIAEKLGIPGDGRYPPPPSNEAYGTAEASIIQANGDPCCDLLYSVPWAFIGLHEAAAATGDRKCKQAEDRLAKFLCRVQVRSDAHPQFDGAWMRGFDYELWEPWGSGADFGWGAWSIESGWTNAWIASVLAMRKLGTTLFDVTLAKRLKKRMPSLVKEMLTERPLKPSRAPVSAGGIVPGSEQGATT